MAADGMTMAIKFVREQKKREDEKCHCPRHSQAALSPPHISRYEHSNYSRSRRCRCRRRDILN